MTKTQLQEYIDTLYTDIEKDMDDNAHSSARMVAKVVNRLYSLGMMLEIMPPPAPMMGRNPHAGGYNARQAAVRVRTRSRCRRI